jgi:hypothetical protein
MREFRAPLFALALFIVGQSGASSFAQESSPPVQDLQNIFPKKPPYSPYADRHFPERVYWGDTHLHTAISLDAERPGAAWARATRIASRRANKSWPRADSP